MITKFLQKLFSRKKIMSCSKHNMFPVGNTIANNESYIHNDIVYRCIKLIQKEFIKKTIKVNSINGEIIYAFNRPNENQSQVDFFENIISSLMTAGNVYIQVVTNAFNLPISMYVLNPKLVNVQVSSSGLKQYLYDNGCTKKVFKTNPITGSCDIIHIKNNGFDHDLYGLSPIEIIKPSVDILNKINTCNLSILNNMSNPSVIIKINEGANISEEEKARLINSFKESYQGTNNAGKMMLVEGPCTVNMMNTNTNNLIYAKEQEIEIEKICNVYGVPLIFVSSVSKHYMSYFSYDKALEFFQNTTIKSLSLKLEKSFNNWFVNKNIDCNIKIK